MQFTGTELAGVWVIDPTPGVDSRGSLMARMDAGRDGAAASAQVPGTGHPAALVAAL